MMPESGVWYRFGVPKAGAFVSARLPSGESDSGWFVPRAPDDQDEGYIGYLKSGIAPGWVVRFLHSPIWWLEIAAPPMPDGSNDPMASDPSQCGAVIPEGM